MPVNKRKISLRLLRKGALIGETYAAFREWDLSFSIRENLQEIREGNLIGAGNDSWLREVLLTISSRFDKTEDLEPLVITAKGDLSIDIWKACLLWHVGNIDELYFRFASDWLFIQYKDGAFFLRSDEAVPFVRKATDGRIASGGKLSEYSVLRTARDLFKTAVDFGILEGQGEKKIRQLPYSGRSVRLCIARPCRRRSEYLENRFVQKLASLSHGTPTTWSVSCSGFTNIKFWSTR